MRLIVEIQAVGHQLFQLDFRRTFEPSAIASAAPVAPIATAITTTAAISAAASTFAASATLTAAATFAWRTVFPLLFLFRHR
jgi:hypothetical protein